MNILVLTPIYPGPDIQTTNTPVVHYFTREWVKMGHKVMVVHLSKYYSKLFYLMPGLLKSILVNINKGVLPERRIDYPLDYETEGVRVTRIPEFRPYPSHIPSYHKQDQQVESILAKLTEYGFTPDRIVSHWHNPLYISHKLKEKFGVKTAMVMHDAFGRLRKFKDSQRLIDDIDLWGVRSVSMMDALRQVVGKGKEIFLCPSGIPSGMIDHNTALDRWNDRYIYVGYMLDRKHPDKLLAALEKVYGKQKFHLDLIGDGELLPSLRRHVEEAALGDSVNITGRLKREDIMPKLDNADCFVMISEAEVFGLVYLEAMARGCIVVAGRGEGMTGIIEHGVNGYLCEPGNTEELSAILQHVRQMTPQQRIDMRQAAMATVSEYTDQKCAERYLDNIAKA